MMHVKEKNREKLQALANTSGDYILMEMFWDMFDDLTVAKQKIYLERAERITNGHDV